MSIPEIGAVERCPAAEKPRELLPSKENLSPVTPYMSLAAYLLWQSLKLTLHSGMGTEMVDIYVGPSKVLFRLYKSKICARIQIFNGNFREASENTAYLPEDSPASFDLLADWANHPTPRSVPGGYETWRL